MPKADARKAGVGTETQIISKEVYEKVEQSKFIPLVCEFAEDATPFLPTFLKLNTPNLNFKCTSGLIWKENQD